MSKSGVYVLIFIFVSTKLNSFVRIVFLERSEQIIRIGKFANAIPTTTTLDSEILQHTDSELVTGARVA